MDFKQKGENKQINNMNEKDIYLNLGTAILDSLKDNNIEKWDKSVLAV
ncbi:hypothetical protein MY04_4689 [Flammeovirga sp. MY04]|nr:hypothetical protein [Flammeovirga sp. MY04]ANQ52024.1 hypothetical protein MY04_4689 [Flammeovirga sp. MY04]